jgi:hypothetical protein
LAQLASRKFWFEPSWTLALFSEAGPFLQKEKNVISNVLILKKYPPLSITSKILAERSVPTKKKKQNVS